MVRLRSLPLLLSVTSLTLAFATPALAQTDPPAAGPPATTPETVPTAPAETAEPAAAPSAPPATPPPAAPTATIDVAPPSAVPVPPSHNDYDGPPLLFSGDKKKKLHVGAYGSLGVAYTRMLHRNGALVSLEAAVLVDHRLSIGLAGYGFSRTPGGPDAVDGTAREFGTGYGGLTVRYAVFAPSFPVYASFGVLVGGGVLGLDTERGWEDDDWDDDDDDDDWRSRDERIEGYFVTQPDITLHVNATRWLRFGVTGGYRFASGVDAFGYDSTAMSGAVVGGNIQLGWF
jgi:hypothetical protein